MRRTVMFSIALCLFICVIFFLYFDNSSNNYYCEEFYIEPEYWVCDVMYYPTNTEKMSMINSLIRKKEAGISPTREELLDAIILAPREDMPGLNGTVCNNNIFVRDDLSDEATLFVGRHELDHFFQWANIEESCMRNEFCATMNSAAEYPSGFIETIVSSLIYSYQITPDKMCFLYGSWNIFKMDILP